MHHIWAICREPKSILACMGLICLNSRQIYIFQYPRSDRRQCNYLATYEGWMYVLVLSVSSVGSEAMQQCPKT